MIPCLDCGFEGKFEQAEHHKNANISVYICPECGAVY